MFILDSFKKATANHPLFPEVTESNLYFHKDWLLPPLQSALSVIINISRIVSMKIHSNYFNEYDQNTWENIGIFMEQAHNLSSLIILTSAYTYNSDQAIENISSILPYHLKDLEISINDLERINRILQ
jgi:hypothetical protein